MPFGRLVGLLAQSGWRGLGSRWLARVFAGIGRLNVYFLTQGRANLQQVFSETQRQTRAKRIWQTVRLAMADNRAKQWPR